MEFKEIVDYVIGNGMSVVIIAYFLWRDNKYTNQLITLMTELKQCINKFSEKLEDEEK